MRFPFFAMWQYAVAVCYKCSKVRQLMQQRYQKAVFIERDVYRDAVRFTSARRGTIISVYAFTLSCKRKVNIMLRKKGSYHSECALR